MSEPMMPAWAEKLERTTPNAALELEMLRHFFASWEALHNLPQDKDHRKKAEAAAQVLVDAAQSIYTLRGEGIRQLNG